LFNFSEKITQNDVEKIIDMLFAHGMITESNNTISYGF